MTEASDKATVTSTPEAPAPAADAAAAAAPAPTTSSESEKPKAVFVENLSPSVTTKMLNEFFSLCGPIESITVRPKPNADDGTLEAIVFFESSGAADTAVLLTNAILVDRIISITYFNGKSAKETKTEEGGADAAAGEGSGESASVWATILAAGYRLGDNISTAATQIEEKYGVKKGFEDTMDKIDVSLGLSTKAAAFSDAVKQKSEEYHVSEKLDAVGATLTQAGEQIGRTANSVVEATMQNQYVSSALNTLSGWGNAIVSSWLSVADEANQLYARQTGQQQQPANAQPAEAAAATAAADPDTVTVPKDASEEKPAEPSSAEVKVPAASNEGEPAAK